MELWKKDIGELLKWPLNHKKIEQILYICYIILFQNKTNMNNLKFVCLFLACLYVTACQDSSSAHQEATTSEQSAVTYQRVANADFKKLMTNMPNAHLVDVRTPSEYTGGHIGKAQNIDYNGSDFKAKIDALDKSKPILVYCQAGGRSKKACTMMKGMGFKEIYELKSGYGGWK